ncbi:MAG: GntR family transcriptional regulator [Cumulibacter sp.]
MEDPLDLSTVTGPNLTARLEILLRRNIAEGIWSVSEAIPREVEIAERTGVSRNTVRTAIQRLVSDGLVERVKGHGTFVTPPRSPVSVGVARIRETIHLVMPTPVARIVRDEYVTPPPAVAEAFGLHEGEKLYYLERVRYQMLAASEPVMFHYAWLLPDLAGGIDKRRLTLGRLQDQLLEKCGLRPVRITETLSALGANATEARELDVPLGSPLLLLEERRFDSSERLYTMARFAIVPQLLQLEFEHTPPDTPDF